MNVKASVLLGGVLLLAAMFAPSANAALVGVTQSYPDATLSGVTLIYDANGGGSGIGRLVVVSRGSVLNRAAGAGNSTTAQLYSGAGDTTNIWEEMFTIDINSTTGAFISGTVSINLGNANPNAQRFSWTGTVTNFGFAPDGRSFDASWVMTADTYTGLPTGWGNFVNGYLTGLRGGIIIGNTSGFSTALGFAAAMDGAGGNFSRDWIIGADANNTTLRSLYTGALTSPIASAATVTADVFVPLPGAALLLGSGIAGLLPLLRRRRPQPAA